MTSIGRTIGVVADYTVGTGIVMLHMFLVGRDRPRTGVRDEDRERSVADLGWPPAPRERSRSR